jgi:hypothetical protein
MTLIQRYVALWNEPDPTARREGIRELWAAEGVHLLQPPLEARNIAAAIGFDLTALEARGHAALEVRVARAYEEFVAPGEFRFRAQDDGDRVGDMVKFRWDMVSATAGVAAVGLEILVLDPDGRITADYQFIEA